MKLKSHNLELQTACLMAVDAATLEYTKVIQEAVQLSVNDFYSCRERNDEQGEQTALLVMDMLNGLQLKIQKLRDVECCKIKTRYEVEAID